MTVELLNNQNLWDKFIDESPSGLLFHKWNYLKIVEKYTGNKLLTYGVYKGDSLIGVMPVFYKNMINKSIIFSPPPKTATPYLGFVMSKDYYDLKQSKKENYLNYFVEKIEKEQIFKNLIYLQLSLIPNFLDVRPFLWNNYIVEINPTFIVDLNESIENIWINFSKDLRNKLRSAEKNGFEVKSGGDMKQLHEMVKKRYEDQKISAPLINKDFLIDLCDAFPDNIKTYYIVNENGEIISASATQEYKKRFIDWLGSTKTTNNANEFMEWTLIKHAKSKEYDLFDFVGAGVKNISTFKSKFNPVLEINYSVYKKNALGKAAEWVYINFWKRRLI